MKTLSPKVNLIFSIGALVLAFSLSVFVIFGWFLLSSATSSDIESNVIGENCSVDFTFNGEPTSNKLELIGAMPGIEFVFTATIVNTSGKTGYITVDIFYKKHPIIENEIEIGDMRDAFEVKYGDPTVTFPFKGAEKINMIKDKELPIGIISSGDKKNDTQIIKFSIIMRNGGENEDMNIYQGKEFLIDKLEIKVVPA